MITTAHAGTLSSGASSTSGAATSHKENPAAALDPIATNAGVSKITKEFAAVDFDHTKQEVVHAVEKLGEVIAGGLTGIGAAHEGREIPNIKEFWAKKGSASVTSAFGKNIHDIEPTDKNVTTSTINTTSTTATPSAPTSSTALGQNGVTPLGGMAAFSSPIAALPGATGLPPVGAAFSGPAANTTSRDGGSQVQDGSSTPAAPTLPPVTGGPALYPSDKSAPEPIKIEEPKTSTSQIQNETAKDGAHAPALNGNVAGAPTTAAGNTGTTGATSGSHTGATTAATGGAAAASAATTAAHGHHSDEHDKKQPSIIDDLKKGIKGGHDSVTHAPTGSAEQGGMLGAPVVADHESHGLINNNKKDAAHLGLPAIPTEGSSKPPSTPKKTAAVGGSSGTPNTPGKDTYNTAPSTPSKTPDERKRKTSM